MRLRWVAAISLVVTYFFFFEYLPPARWVDITYDLRGFHYPLDNFAFQSLWQGRIPEWDPTMYCGMSFAGNSQAAMYYPPMWLVFAANIGNSRMKYRPLEAMQIAHVWLAFVLCFVWLRGRKLHDLACVFGALSFACGGAMLMQLSHLGMMCAVAWAPLALWAVDRLVQGWNARAFATLCAALALSFLAGHPPAWFVVIVCTLAYAIFSSLRAVLSTVASIAVSMLIAAVQLFPSIEAAQLKEAHAQYGAGITRLAFYNSYFIPNFYDFGIDTDAFTNPGFEYLYLGVPAIFGLACLLIWARRCREALPIAAILIASLILLTNPFGWVWAVIQHSDLLEQICRSWQFLGGIGIATAGLAAYGLDAFIKSGAKPWRPWLLPVTIAALIFWAVHLMRLWWPGGRGFAIGWRGAVEPAVLLLLFAIAIFGWTVERDARRMILSIAMIATIVVDYKVFGTSKRTHANHENADRMLWRASLPGMPEAVYRELHEAPHYRIGLDSNLPPTDFHLYGLATPQGGDPLVPKQYQSILRPEGEYYDFVPLDPSDKGLLKLLGVRYFVTPADRPLYPKLIADPEFRLLSKDGYFLAFEYTRAEPIYRWENPQPKDRVDDTRWTAEDRDFTVHAESGGRFILIEEMYPGWRVLLDGHPAPDERWRDVFQSVTVPAGEHRIQFQFRSLTLRIGAIVSCLTIAGLGLLAGFRRRPMPCR